MPDRACAKTFKLAAEHFSLSAAIERLVLERSVYHVASNAPTSANIEKLFGNYLIMLSLSL